MTVKLRKDSQIPAYMAYPRFLLKADLSETAKLVDVLLLDRARIYDRVLERCTAIKVNDQNIRKLNMAENLTKAKQLLEGVTV